MLDLGKKGFCLPINSYKAINRFLLAILQLIGHYLVNFLVKASNF
jgi:hypothetical protein